MKKLRIVMGALALAVVAAAIIACNKEKEQANTQLTNNEITRKPIATKDLNTGIISYNFSIESLQKGFDNVFSTKDNRDRYVVESLEIEEDAFSYDTISLSALKIVYLDTELEQSITQWFFGGFIEEVLDEENKYYFLGEGIAEGTYSYITSGETNIMYSVQNGIVTSSEVVNGADYGPIFGWNLTCTASPRCIGCYKHNPGGTWGGWTCDCRNGFNPDNGIYCESSFSSGNTIAIIGIIVMIIIAI